MSPPANDERILEAAERIDGLSESGQERALAALAPSDREQVVLAMIANATMVEELTSVLENALAPESAERYAAALRTLSWRVLRVARAGVQSAMQPAIAELVAEHPELQEQANTVEVFLLTRRA